MTGFMLISIILLINYSLIIFFFYDKFHLYSSSFLCIDLISFLSFVSNELFLSLWINFLADMYMHMFPHIICFMYSNFAPYKVIRNPESR